MGDDIILSFIPKVDGFDVVFLTAVVTNPFEDT